MYNKYSPTPWTKEPVLGLVDKYGNAVCIWGSSISFGLRTPQTEANGNIVDNAAELYEALEEASLALRNANVDILADKYDKVLAKARGEVLHD